MDFGYPQTTESKILQEWVSSAIRSGPAKAFFNRREGRSLLYYFDTDILRKNPINSRSKLVLQLPSQMPFHGVAKAFDTARTKCFSMSSNRSIFSFPPLAMSSVQKFLVL